ncbi:hypothetical protein CC79DRAFT_1315948 [Sarocladium strictum]
MYFPVHLIVAILATSVNLPAANAFVVTIEPRVAFDPQYIPSNFGLQASEIPNPASNGRDCLNRVGVSVPCACPPSPNDAQFRGNIQTALDKGAFPGGSPASVPISSDEWNDPGTPQRLRATVMIVALQSLSGTLGVGCPGASYPVLVQQQLS